MDLKIQALSRRGAGSLWSCQPCVFDHESLKPEKIDNDLLGMFLDLDHESGDAMVAVAWAMAEKLEKLGS